MSDLLTDTPTPTPTSFRSDLPISLPTVLGITNPGSCYVTPYDLGLGVATCLYFTVAAGSPGEPNVATLVEPGDLPGTGPGTGGIPGTSTIILANTDVPWDLPEPAEPVPNLTLFGAISKQIGATVTTNTSGNNALLAAITPIQGATINSITINQGTKLRGVILVFALTDGSGNVTALYPTIDPDVDPSITT